MRSIFASVPMLRILLIWILGILFNFSFNPSFTLIVGLFVGTVIISLLIKHPLLKSFGLLMGLFLLSISYNQSFFIAIHQHVPRIESFVMYIQKPAKEKPKTWEVIAEIKQFKSSNHWQNNPRSWKIKAYFSKKIPKPHVGQHWIISDSIRQFEKPIFPFEKDWKTYFIQKGIIGTVFVHATNAKVLRPFAQESFLFLFQKFQTYFLKSLSYIPSRENKEVAEAMLLGETAGINAELQESYTTLGAVHILSVSGMHLGLLFWVIHLFFKKIESYFPKLNYLSFLVMVSILWFYAGMTGFSAPVLRATWVFTLILVAKYFHFHLNALNILATSAWLLLLINPFELHNPGFQLSYLAVLGLIEFQKPISKLFSFNQKKIAGFLMYYLWESTSVALAAQILTLPLVIFYFYQIPNLFYFFLLNPILTILSSISLVSGFILLGLYPLIEFCDISILGELIGICVNFSFECMHQFMLYFSNGKAHAISFLYLSFTETFIIYYAIACLFIWVRIRKAHYLYVFNGICLYFFVGYTYFLPKQIEVQNVKKIFESRGQVIGIKLLADQMAVFGPANLLHDHQWFSSHLTPMAAHYHIKDTLLIAVHEK